MLNFSSILHERPQANALLRGSQEYPTLEAIAYFYQTNIGVLVAIEAVNLPTTSSPCTNPVFALHLHSGESCTGNDVDPFANALTHYNPSNCPHPYHSGDMPPLFGNNGYAFSAFLTDRFTVQEIIGKTLVVHGNRDDFTTQPAGDSGKKIACGVIKKLNK